MDVKHGYRVTDVGALPSEWGLVPFSEILEFRNGVNAAKAAYGGGVRFINVLEVITRSHLSASDIPGRISLSEQALAPYAVRRGDVVFNRTSETQEEVGLAAVYNDDELVVFGGFVIRGRPTTSEALDPIYSGYALRSKPIRRQVIARGQGAIRANIGQQDLRSVLVPRPPLPEQKAIAAALSDVDALLDALDRLIAKKRDLKQAAMQQLLTGQTRLPGFNGEWNVGTLADVIGALEAGVSVNSVEDDGAGGHDGMYILKTSAVEGGRFIPQECKRVAPRDLGRARLSPRKQTLLVSRMNTPDLVGECGYVDRDYPNLFVPDRIWMTRFRQESDASALWLSYVLSTPALKRQIGAAATGTSGSMKNLSKQAFMQIPVAFPPGAEQEAIASVLADMDAEFTALEQRRNKTRLLKQGMMQELLTGRTRLV